MIYQYAFEVRVLSIRADGWQNSPTASCELSTTYHVSLEIPHFLHDLKHIMKQPMVHSYWQEEIILKIEYLCAVTD